MLKGDVFEEQVFENPIFALFINTFLDGNNGVASGYKNNMALSKSGGNVTIASGAVCIQGRFMHEDTTTTLSVGETSKFHKLVIEIDLDKTNTAQSFEQAYYKILTSSSDYPSLTQTDIVKNVSGIYQYELARFKTDGSGNITNWDDRRTFLDIESIYTAIQTSYTALLNQLKVELQKARNDSFYALKDEVAYTDGEGIISIDSTLSRTTYVGTCYTVDDENLKTELTFTIPLPKHALTTLNETNTTFTITKLEGGIVAGNGDVIVPKGTDLSENTNPSIFANHFTIKDNCLLLTISFRNSEPQTNQIVLAYPYLLYVNDIRISFEPI